MLLAGDRQPTACVMFATTGLVFEGQKVEGGEAEKPPVTRQSAPENKPYMALTLIPLINNKLMFHGTGITTNNK